MEKKKRPGSTPRADGGRSKTKSAGQNAGPSRPKKDHAGRGNRAPSSS